MWLKCNIAEKLICWKLLLPGHWVIQGFCGPEELDRVSTPNISKNNISVLFLFKMLACNQTFADFVIFSSFHVMDELIYVTVALWHLKFFVKYSFSWNSVNFILAFFFFNLKNLFIYFTWRLITILWWFLPYVNMNQPQVYVSTHPQAHPSTSLPIPSLRAVPVHQLWVSCFMRWTWTGLLFHIW